MISQPIDPIRAPHWGSRPIALLLRDPRRRDRLPLLSSRTALLVGPTIATPWRTRTELFCGREFELVEQNQIDSI